jgi:hypothetical protein
MNITLKNNGPMTIFLDTKSWNEIIQLEL